MPSAVAEQVRCARELEESYDDALYRARIERYGTNPFMAWTLRYLPHHMVYQDGPLKGQFCPPAPFHQQLTAELYEALISQEPYRRICGELGRGLAKTTYGTTALALYAIGEHDKRNVLPICQTKDEAKDRIRNIVEELENNEQLKRDYPELVAARDIKGQTKSYTDYQIILANGARIKAYEFGRGKLRGSNWMGKRPDLVILDDPEPDDFAFSETYRERAWHWLQATVLKAMSKHALLVWLATPVGAEALVRRARTAPDDSDNPGLGWKGPFVPIATEVRGGDGAQVLDYRPAWPAMHTPEDIALLLSEGDPAIARQELMLELISRGSNPFDVAWFDEHTYDPALLKRHSAGIYDYDGVRLSRVQGHIDSGLSADPSADFTAIIVAALHPRQRKLLVLRLVYEHLEVPDQLDRLVELHQYYNFQAIGYQAAMLERVLQQFTKRITSLPLEPVAVSTMAAAKERRIRQSALYHRNAYLLFNPEDPEQRHLRKEMKTFPGGHDDALDAAECLITRVMEAGPPAKPSDVKTHRVSDEAQRMRGGW